MSRIVKATPTLPFAFCLLLAALAAPRGASAAQFAATHLVFEKPVKMKKAGVTLYLQFPDPSVRGSEPTDRRRLRCSSAGRAKRGAVAAAGRLSLRLLGEVEASAERWSSGAVERALDDRGGARFEDDEILQLVDQAAAAGVLLESLSVELDGGKGAKVLELTLDCAHEGVEG